MTKKHTVPNEPEEFPMEPGRPEIKPPNDPSEPTAPHEAPGNMPQEFPPDETDKPEIAPDTSTI